MSGAIEQLLSSRGLASESSQQAFFNPDYELSKHNPFLLPDMHSAVERLVKAKAKKELVYIYGDYDIDGLTATALLLDAFTSFGIRVEAFIPNRFVEGYGLSKPAIKKLAGEGAKLIVTVDCGSLSHSEVELANSLGVDVIITDHHSVADTMPQAVATINPKRTDHRYPFVDLAGVGVAFKLVQAMQQKTEGLPAGQEKWLLDLVALGTVCDVVQLLDENRANVIWGLRVLAKTKRPGLVALCQVIGLDVNKLNARSLGFMIGPHLNASGRLETAQLSLDLLTTNDPLKAVEIAYRLRQLNEERRASQHIITKQALEQAAKYKEDPVLVLSHANWSHGIVGIVAAKILESQFKPTFILQEIGNESKGSARSFGDFSAVEAVRAVDELLIKGGGHKFAAGVTLKTNNISEFRKRVNDFYKTLGLRNQLKYLEPKADVGTDNISDFDEALMLAVKRFEPFGQGNPEPVFHLRSGVVQKRRLMGRDESHIKLDIADGSGNIMQFVGFGMANLCQQEVGDKVEVWFKLVENDWDGRVSLEGQLMKVVHLEL